MNDPLLQPPTHPGRYRTRTDIVAEFCPGKHCAEVGVAFGWFSAEIIKARPAMLYLIDPWLHQPESVYPGDKANEPDANFSATYDAVRREFGRLPNAVIMRVAGFDAARSFPDEVFDFVFIDAIHTVAMVVADAVTWWPKVKRGGVLAFHDFNLGEMPGCPALSVNAALQNFLYLLHREKLDIVTDEQESCAIIK